MKPIYTIVFRQYESEWLALCLENGIVSQGHSRLEAEAKLREAIETVNDVLREEPAVYQASVPVSELHDGAGELSPPYVLRIFRQFGFSDLEIEALLRR
jgi:predicted RNase H-like HicB family nuclease